MHQNISIGHQYVNQIPEIPESPLPKAPRSSSRGLHVATGYTRVFIGGRSPYIEFLPGHLIWESLHIPDQEKYRTEHPWKEKVFCVEWRTKDQSDVKVYDQKRAVEYADYKAGLFYISPFDLFVQGEPVITKLERKKSKAPSE
jgi:hypothetical protein